VSALILGAPSAAAGRRYSGASLRRVSGTSGSADPRPAELSVTDLRAMLGPRASASGGVYVRC
jgi:hypothetical protein